MMARVFNGYLASAAVCSLPTTMLANGAETIIFSFPRQIATGEAFPSRVDQADQNLMHVMDTVLPTSPDEHANAGK